MSAPYVFPAEVRLVPTPERPRYTPRREARDTFAQLVEAVGEVEASVLAARRLRR